MYLQLIEKRFSSCRCVEETYQTIMEWGKSLPSFKDEWKIESNLVPGCQSIMYLKTSFSECKLYFAAHCDALISAGLAAILIEAYNGESPETLLKNPPDFLDKLGIATSLTPGRANGLASLYFKMKQEALKHLTESF